MKIWIPFILLLLLSGCGEFRDLVLQRGGKFYDESLNTAILWKCRASSVGAIGRKYMLTEDTWKMWTDECLGQGAIALPASDDGEEIILTPLPRRE